MAPVPELVPTTPSPALFTLAPAPVLVKVNALVASRSTCVLAELPVLEKAYDFLKEGRGLWEANLSDSERAALSPLTLLTAKPVLYAANVSDSELHGDEGPHLKALREAAASPEVGRRQ